MLATWRTAFLISLSVAVLLPVTVQAAPKSSSLAAPSSLIASPTSNSITLTWIDNTGSETGFGIERSLIPSASFSRIATTGKNIQSYRDTAVVPATAYYYRVVALSRGGAASPPSNVASAIVPATTDTTAPAISITSPASGTMATTPSTVMITAAASDNVTVTRVEFYDGGVLKGSVATPPYTHGWGVTSAENGSHSWTAKAFDASGNSSTSAATTITVSIDVTAPSVPTNVVATATSCTRVDVVWAASTDPGGSGVKAYNVYRNGAFLKQVLAPATSTSDTGVLASTTYSYTVAAVDNAGNESAQGSGTSAAVPACPDTAAPTVPSAITVSAGSCSQINVSWGSSTDSGGSGLRGYNVYRNGVFLKQVLAPGTSTTDVGLTASTTYSYAVSAVDNAGNQSSSTASVSSVTPSCPDTTAPTVPSGVTVSASTCSQMNVSWGNSTDSGGSGLKGYNVYRNGVFLKQVLAPGTSTTDMGLTASTTYSYAVSAIDNAGNQSVSTASASSATPACSDATAPSTPSGVTASARSCNQADVAWTASTDSGGSGLKGYNLYRNGVFVRQILAPAVSASDTGLTASTTYVYTLSAVDNAGNQSLQSTGASTSTQACADTTPPAVPTGLTASAPTCDQVNLGWNATTDTGGSGLKSYKIYRGGVFLKEILAPGTSTTDAGLTASTAYSYAVSGVDNANNESGRSNTLATNTPACADTMAPTIPTGLRAWAASCTQIGVMWSPSTDNTGGSGLKGYNIYRDGVFLRQVAGTSLLDAVPDASRTYAYIVTAVDNAGNQSAISNAASASLASLVNFKSQVAYPTGAGPYSVAVGDLNGDGIVDLVVANNGGNSVSVLLGRGDGTFLPHVTYATGLSPRSVAVADLNGDGRLDVVTANTGSNNISVLLGRGDGTLQPHATYATGSAPTAVAVADLNRDGVPDVAVTNFSVGTVSVLLGNGTGTFQTQTVFAVGRSPLAIAIADLDGDGDPDIVTANSGSGDISVLLGQGDGTFLPQVRYPTGSSPKSVAIGDLNADGTPDLAVANYGDATLSVLLGHGDGGFQTLPAQVIYSGPASLAIGTPNGDGIPDLAITSQAGNLVSIYAGTGTGTFAASGATPATGTGPVFVTVGDFTRDGGSDLAVANFSSNTVSVILNACQ